MGIGLGKSAPDHLGEEADLRRRRCMQYEGLNALVGLGLASPLILTASTGVIVAKFNLSTRQKSRRFLALPSSGLVVLAWGACNPYRTLRSPTCYSPFKL